MFLFDTDVLSNVVKPRPARPLLRRLEHLPGAVQFTTAINVGEIYFGACRSAQKHRILDAFTAKVFPNLNILAFDEHGARIFGELKAELEKAGIGCSEPDLRQCPGTNAVHFRYPSELWRKPPRKRPWVP